ncbi:hypothetical protein EV363DRAFT_1295609 [Boletus edulis]|nr:hypothetical protein EV363DRAFT_1295609 [Boletus edulis]
MQKSSSSLFNLWANLPLKTGCLYVVLGDLRGRKTVQQLGWLFCINDSESTIEGSLKSIIGSSSRQKIQALCDRFIDSGNYREIYSTLSAVEELDTRLRKLTTIHLRNGGSDSISESATQTSIRAVIKALEDLLVNAMEGVNTRYYDLDLPIPHKGSLASSPNVTIIIDSLAAHRILRIVSGALLKSLLETFSAIRDWGLNRDISWVHSRPSQHRFISGHFAIFLQVPFYSSIHYGTCPVQVRCELTKSGLIFGLSDPDYLRLDTKQAGLRTILGLNHRI